VPQVALPDLQRQLRLRVQRLSHPVRRGGQLPDLVTALHGHAGREIAYGDLPQAGDQPQDGAGDHAGDDDAQQGGQDDADDAADDEDVGGVGQRRRRLAGCGRGVPHAGPCRILGGGEHLDGYGVALLADLLAGGPGVEEGLHAAPVGLAGLPALGELSQVGLLLGAGLQLVELGADPVESLHRAPQQLGVAGRLGAPDVEAHIDPQLHDLAADLDLPCAILDRGGVAAAGG